MTASEIKSAYLALAPDEPSKKDFLNGSTYNYSSKKYIVNWDKPERLDLEIVLRQVDEDQVTGTLKNIQEWFEIWSNDYPIYELKTSYASIHRGCGDYEHIFELIGVRKETDEEFNLRQQLLGN